MTEIEIKDGYVIDMGPSLVDRVAKILEPCVFRDYEGTFDADYPESLRLRDRAILLERMDGTRATARLVIAEILRPPPDAHYSGLQTARTQPG